MSTTLEGTAVAAFRLPISLRNIEALTPLVESLYGGGDYLMRFNGDALHIIAPFELYPAPPLPVIPDGDGDISLAKATFDGERMELTLESASETVGMLAHAMRQYFKLAGGVNFVEATLLPQPDDTDPVVMTVQRVNGETPATLLATANERIAELEKELSARTSARQVSP